MSPSNATGDAGDEATEQASSSASAAAPSTARTVLDFESKTQLRKALRDFTKHSKRNSEYSVNSCCLYSSSEEDFDDDDDFDLDDGKLPTDPLSADWVTDNLDVDTSVPQTISHETERLMVLKSYLMLDSDREPEFERLTALAQRFFSVPIALVSLVDLGRQWFMSNRGLGDVRETPRKLAFCAHAVQSTQDLLVVPDATRDPRFMNSGLVRGPPHIRFYAGAPLLCPEGYNLGTLCVIDSVARPEGLSLNEKQTLRELAALVMEAMVRRRRDRMELAADRSREMACMARDLTTPLGVVRRSLRSVKDAVGEQKDIYNGNNVSSHIESADTCLDVMERICDETISGFRSDLAEEIERKTKMPMPASASAASLPIFEDVTEGKEEDSHDADEKEDADASPGAPAVVNVSKLVRSLRSAMDEDYPNSYGRAPVTITVDPNVPPEFMSDGLKLFRSALNFLTNTARHAGGAGSKVELRIYVKEQQLKKNGLPERAVLVFECTDEGSGVPVEDRNRLFRPFPETTAAAPASSSSSRQGNDENGIFIGNGNKEKGRGLGLYSVAVNISSLGGRYGYRPRSADDARNDPSQPPSSSSSSGSVFWFSVPLVVGYCTSFRERKDDDGAAAADKKPTASANGSPTASGSPTSTTSSKPKRKMLSLAQSGDYDRDAVFDAVNRAMESKDSEDDSDDRPAPKQPPITADQPAKYALVIDDSVVIRKSIGRALTELGFQVEYACDGMEGLAALQSFKFDVVFCDFLMPVLDGLDCIDQYRCWESNHRPNHHVKIVGLSAHASEADVERGTKAGMDGFVSKDSKMMDLLKKAMDLTENFDAKKKKKNREENGGGGGGGRRRNGESSANGGGTAGEISSSSDLNLRMSELAARSAYSASRVGGRPGSFHPKHTHTAAPSLSIARHRVMNGAIIENAGNTCIPSNRQRRPAAADAAAGASTRSSCLRRPECLIVEDSRSALKLLTRAVESSSWRVTVADDEEHAQVLLKTKKWGAALVDSEAPVAAFREWESQNRSVRQNNIYLMRPESNTGPAAASCPRGYDGILRKPATAEDVLKLLERAALRQHDREEIDR